MVPTLLGWPAEDARKRVDELLDLVGLPAPEYRNRAPSALSGGQQQRVGVARALAARPPLVLMDEPFGALDPVTRHSLREEYRRIHRELALTTVMVTHDMGEALLVADRIVVMHEGAVVGQGTPRELLANPGHDLVQRLLDVPRQQADAVDALRASPGAP
jgi:osmoprotectant transport system ATP-binding protein